MKGICHIHTDNSIDSSNKIQDIYRFCKEQSMDFIAITDHDSLAGAIAFKQAYGNEILTIVGAEYSTTIGHVMVLFLKRGLEELLLKNENGLYDFNEVVCEARKQEALLVAAHPKMIAKEFLVHLDGIEVFNSRVLDPDRNKRAEVMAMENDKLMFGGADAHLYKELGNCHMIIDGNANDVVELKKMIENGFVSEIHCSIGNYSNVALSQMIKLKRMNEGLSFYWLKQLVKIIISPLFWIKKKINIKEYNYIIKSGRCKLCGS